MIHVAKTYWNPYHEKLGNSTPWSKGVAFCARITLLVAFILSAACAGGHMAGFGGWMAIGFGTLYLGLKLLGGNVHRRKLDLIFAIAISSLVFLFASLSSAHQISTICMGRALTIGLLAYGTGALCLMIYFKRTKKELFEEDKN